MPLSLLFAIGCGGAPITTGSAALATTTGEAVEIAGETDIVSSVAAMEKGDILLVDLSSGSGAIDFSSAASSAKFRLVVQSTKKLAGSVTASLGDLSAAPSISAKGASNLGTSLGAQQFFDAMLRKAESQLVEAQINPALSIGAKAFTKATSVGATKTFRVLSSLFTTSSYKEVTATARCVTSRIVYYVDNTDTDALSASDIATLCDQFDTALEREFAILGEPPDLNGDGTVSVLATHVVNETGGSVGGIVTGFFFGGDLLQRSSSNPASNEEEVIFTLVPDPNGDYGTEIPKDFAMNNLITAVVPHEVQHLLSYYHKVIAGGGGSEASWLNEAMAHLIEDVVGYGQENPSRVELFLASMSDSALVPFGSPGLTERGAAYLFLRFLYEQSGKSSAFLKTLVQSAETSVSNIEAAYPKGVDGFDEWTEFLRRWGVALAVTNQNVTSDGRYIYASRTQDATTGHYEGVCLVCSAEDGRDTTLVGPSLLSSTGSASIAAGANAVYDLSTPPSQLTVTASGEDLQGILIRVQ
jgi:hypothetical protein